MKKFDFSVTTDFVQFLESFDLDYFCVLVVFPAVLLYTTRLVRWLQYQFIRYW